MRYGMVLSAACTICGVVANVFALRSVTNGEEAAGAFMFAAAVYLYGKADRFSLQSRIAQLEQLVDIMMDRGCK